MAVWAFDITSHISILLKLFLLKSCIIVCFQQSNVIMVRMSHLSTPSLMWWFGGRAPPSFSHSILVSTPPAAEQVNSTALPWAFTSTWGDTRTAKGATEGRDRDMI